MADQEKTEGEAGREAESTRETTEEVTRQTTEREETHVAPAEGEDAARHGEEHGTF